MTSRTISNRPIKKDLKARSARIVPLLSKKNIVKKLCFAKRHIARENWNIILWSDETKINLFALDGKIYVRRSKNTALNPKHTIKTVKRGGSGIKPWGCFTASRAGPILIKITPNMPQNLLRNGSKTKKFV